MLTPLSTPSEIYIKFGEQLRLYIIMNSINKTHKMITTMLTQELRGKHIFTYIYLQQLKELLPTNNPLVPLKQDSNLNMGYGKMSGRKSFPEKGSTEMATT